MKKVSMLLAMMSAWLVSALPASAAPIFNITGSGLVEETDAQSEIFVILRYLFGAAIPIAVTGIVVGGFMYMIGDEPTTERGKRTITTSIVGLVIVLLAFVIVATVNTILDTD